jgi:hypothetical protein
MKRCKGCGATYEPAQADGSIYFHVCPPALTGLVVRRAGALVTIAPGDLAPGDEEQDRVYSARPGHRDENVQGRGARPNDPRTPGAGADDVRP